MPCDKVEMPKKRALVEREGKSVFESVENKLKTYAKVNFGLVIGTAILAFIVMVSTLNSLNGLGALLVVILYVILVYVDGATVPWDEYEHSGIGTFLPTGRITALDENGKLGEDKSQVYFSLFAKGIYGLLGESDSGVTMFDLGFLVWQLQ